MNIFEKIKNVMSEIEYLTKDDNVSVGTNGSYKAISEEKVTSAVRKSLIKNGIVIIPIKQEHKREDEHVKDKYGSEKISRLTTVDITYRIQNIEDTQDYIEAVSSGTGVDTQDKGIGKAMTYSYKYLLLRTFAIPTGEDTDKISSETYSEQYSKIQKISDIQHKALLNSITNNKISDETVLNILEKYGYNTTTDIEIINYMNIINDFKKIKDKIEGDIK